MATKTAKYEMIFDDVKFGIDVKDARLSFGLLQSQLAKLVGYKDGVSISAIECAKSTESISLKRYFNLCNVLDLNPMHYWQLEPISPDLWTT